MNRSVIFDASIKNISYLSLEGAADSLYLVDCVLSQHRIRTISLGQCKKKRFFLLYRLLKHEKVLAGFHLGLLNAKGYHVHFMNTWALLSIAWISLPSHPSRFPPSLPPLFPLFNFLIPQSSPPWLPGVLSCPLMGSKVLDVYTC